MRQAGRSLPGYREIRKRYSLFEVCRQPELCAEVTLEPVRVHGVDAAVMFADIMLPILGMGIDVELVEGVGPVVAEPVRDDGGRRAVARARSRGGGSVHPRGRPARAWRARSRAGARRLLRRPVHGRGLPRRGQADAGVLGHEALHVRLAGGLARALREARGDVGGVPARDGRGGRGRGAALRLLGRRAVASTTTRSSSRRTRSGSSRPSTCRRSTSAPGTAHLLETMTETGGDVIGLDWRVRLDEGWERVGHDRGVQGNLDPALLLGPFERVESEAIAILDAAGGRPGHIFNLGHGVLPDTDPADLEEDRRARSRTDGDAPHEAGRRPHGLREPVRPRGHPPVPRGHPLAAGRSRTRPSRS